MLHGCGHSVDGIGNMLSSRHVTFVNFVLVLGSATFGQGSPFGQSLDKPQAAVSAREKALLATVTESSQWKPTDPRVAKAYEELAGYYASQGRYADAEKPYEKRLELEEDALGRANPAIIPAIADLARVNFSQMKYDRTAELFQRSLRILEREYGDDSVKLVPTLDGVAKVLQAGAKYPEAEKYLRRAIAIREKTSGADTPEIVAELSQLARGQVARQDLPAAESVYQ